MGQLFYAEQRGWDVRRTGEPRYLLPRLLLEAHELEAPNVGVGCNSAERTAGDVCKRERDDNHCPVVEASPFKVTRKT
jgi:hypothetical protein